MNSRTPAAAAPGRAGVQGAEPLGINTLEYQSTVKRPMKKEIRLFFSFTFWMIDGPTWLMDSRGEKHMRGQHVEHQREAGANEATMCECHKVRYKRAHAIS